MFGSFVKSLAVAGGLTVATASGAFAITVNQLEVLLTVDLTTENEITITATDGASAVTQSGSDVIGFYLANFFASLQTGFNSVTPSGDLTANLNVSDGSPSLFVGGAGNLGLNVWSSSTASTLDFTAGVTAFSGSGTWSLEAADYAAALAGLSSGLIFFPADQDADIEGAVVLGEWERVAPVPLPAALPLLLVGLAGMGVVARRRKD